jgi:hypothetical protein
MLNKSNFFQQDYRTKVSQHLGKKVREINETLFINYEGFKLNGLVLIINEFVSDDNQNILFQKNEIFKVVDIDQDGDLRLENNHHACSVYIKQRNFGNIRSVQVR